MSNHDTWAKSLYHRDVNRNKEPCNWSEKFGVIIHRFGVGQQTCNCGEVTVVKKETSGGWKREPVDDKPENGK